jgi:hypothetical protein
MEEHNLAKEMLRILELRLSDNEKAQLELIDMQIYLLKRISKICILIREIEEKREELNHSE